MALILEQVVGVGGGASFRNRRPAWMGTPISPISHTCPPWPLQSTGHHVHKVFVMRSRLTASMLMVTLLFSAEPAHAQATCQFVMGFATLRDLVGSTVGQCLDNQHFAPNGNAEQQTTGGLLVWRKADNWTAFTDGYRTWINGPLGLQQRLNSQTFLWEASPDRIVTWFLRDFASRAADDTSLLQYFSNRLTDVMNYKPENIALRMCLQNTTPRFSVDKPVANVHGTVSVPAILHFNTPTARRFTLINEGSTWKIDEILCL